jgi:hypothetical protein
MDWQKPKMVVNCRILVENEISKSQSLVEAYEEQHRKPHIDRNLASGGN